MTVHTRDSMRALIERTLRLESQLREMVDLQERRGKVTTPLLTQDARAMLDHVRELAETLAEEAGLSYVAEHMTKAHCKGCYNDDYNHGLGGANECWSFSTANVVLRRRVGVYETPPWKAEPERLPSCYQQRGFIFVGPEVER